MTVGAELVLVITALEEHAGGPPKLICITKPCVEVTEVIVLANGLTFFFIINWGNDINDVITNNVAAIFGAANTGGRPTETIGAL